MMNLMVQRYHCYCYLAALLSWIVVVGMKCFENKVEIKDCGESDTNHNKYRKELNSQWHKYIEEINRTVSLYSPCLTDKCSCHFQLIKQDLMPFQDGISKNAVDDARSRGILYQIIDHQLFREVDCMFPSRCSGVEHFLLKIINKLPDTEFVLNTRDWPQVLKQYGKYKPVFSFSKTSEYADITYPAWTFWEGGPAISIYPTGLGKWEEHRISLMKEGDKWPWSRKKEKAFFRGSRTSSERDSLIYLSRKNPELVDAQYTKNQAWKSNSDTLYAAPAAEVSLESHCQYKYLFNYRGVAASFRFKHLFLCKSLVFHAGQEWIEFFHPQMKPWIHYIPVPSGATEEQIMNLIIFAKENDDVVRNISERGYQFIKNHLRIKDIICYWKKLLLSYSKLLTYKPSIRKDFIEIRKKKKL